MGMSSSSCMISFCMLFSRLSLKWYSFENTSHRHAFCSNKSIKRSVSSSFHILAFPLLSFTTHFQQRPPKRLLRSPVLKHWTSDVRKQNAVSVDTGRWESVVRMRASNMFDTAVQTKKKKHIKHENKRNVLSCLIECLMAFKFYQTRSNTIKDIRCALPRQTC